MTTEPLLIIKPNCPTAVKSKKVIYEWHELYEQYLREGYSLIDAAVQIRLDIDCGRLFPVTCNSTSCVKFTTEKTVTEFHRRQRLLQDALLHANEIAALEVYSEEEKELRKSQKLQSVDFFSKRFAQNNNVRGPQL
jgi:hypothetical protein